RPGDDRIARTNASGATARAAQHGIPWDDRPPRPTARTLGPCRRGPGILSRAHRSRTIVARAGPVAAARRRIDAARGRTRRSPVSIDLSELRFLAAHRGGIGKIVLQRVALH